ncbi:MAG: hypothetical protein ACOZAO_02520 [Patescibacteria group bacterium]
MAKDLTDNQIIRQAVDLIQGQLVVRIIDQGGGAYHVVTRNPKDDGRRWLMVVKLSASKQSASMEDHGVTDVPLPKARGLYKFNWRCGKVVDEP